VRILAIDPGPEISAFCVLLSDGDALALPVDFGLLDNPVLLANLPRLCADHLAIEEMACYGMAVGKSVFRTQLWLGRFIERWSRPFNCILRKGRWGPEPLTTGAEGKYQGVCVHLCRNNGAKDSNIHQALLDRWGGKPKAVGRKKTPGPLYGITGDVWSALAIAVTYADQAMARTET